MRKFFTVFIAAVILINSTVFCAADKQTSVNICANHVYVTYASENSAAEATLVVTGPDMTYAEYAARSNILAAAYFDQKTVSNGTAEFSFPLASDGDYELTVIENGTIKYSDAVKITTDEGINGLTVTRTAPWMVNYHMTTEEQLANSVQGGECGQMVWGIAISSADTDTMLMGTDTAGIYKSENGGKSWRQAGLGFGAQGVTDITFLPGSDKIAFASAAAHGNFRMGAEGIWKTEDAGETWKKVLTCGFKRVVPMHNFAFAGDKVYVGAYDALKATDGTGKTADGGVYVSDDAGETWTNIGLTDKTINSVATVNGKLYVATNDGLYRLDENNSFTCVKSGACLSVVATNEATYCIDSTNLYKSTDGESWQKIKTRSEIGFANGTLAMLTTFGNALGVSAHICSSNFRYTTDGGNTFREPVYNRENAFMKSNSGYYAEGADGLSDGTLIISADGEIYKGKLNGENITLNPSMSGISGMRAENFVFDEDNPENVMITMVDRGVMLTQGLTLSHEYLPVKSLSVPRYDGAVSVYGAARDPRNKNRILISVGSWSNSIIAESTDGGETFKAISGSEGAQCNMLAFNEDNPDIIYAGNRISYNNGVSWVKVQDGMMVEAVSPFDGNKVYAKSGQTVIYVSTNAGESWNLFCDGLDSIQRIRADLEEDDKLWAGTFMYGALMITPGKKEFKNTGLKASDGGIYTVFDIAQNPRNPKHLIAGGCDNYTCTPTAGLFESYDGGNSWRVVEGLTGSRDVWTVEFHPTLPRTYIGTSSGTFVYEYERFSDDELIVSDRTASGFKLWNFAKNKLELCVFTAKYSENAMIEVEADNVNVYRNLMYTHKSALSGNIKQFVWKSDGEPLFNSCG